jgi:spermidine/putrescine-binding protein
MKILLSAFASAVLAVALVAAVWSGAAQAESQDQTVTITGQIVVVEEDAAGNAIVKIVTETEEYLVHQESKASDLSAQAGKTVKATGSIEVTEMNKTISVDEYALIEGQKPPVGAQ